MSEAAVAEPEVSTPSSETPQQDAAIESSTGAEQKPDAGAQATSSQESTGTEGDTGGEIDFASIFEAELKEAHGGDLPAAPTEPDKPGIAVEQYEAQRRQALASDNARVRQTAEAAVTGALVRKYGLSEDEAANAWQNDLRPLWNTIVSTNDAYQSEVDGWITEQLPDATKEIFNKRLYRNRKEWVEGLVEAGRQEMEAKWQADIKAGKYLSRATVEKATVEAGKKVRAQVEALYAKNGLVMGRSGNEVQGEAPGAHYSDVDALYIAWNNKELTRDAYKREHKRLTGKEPGE